MSQHHSNTHTLNNLTSKYQDFEIFKLLVEHSSDGMALFENQILVYSSPSMNKIFGCKDFSGFKTYEDVLKRVHPDDFPGLENKVNEGIEAKCEIQKYQFRFKRDDGTYCWIENSVTRIYDSLGKNVRNVIISRDIAENKKTEQELFQQKKALKTIAENTTAMIYIKDLEGKYLFANKALEEIFLPGGESLIGKKDIDITDKSTATKYRDNDLTVIKTGKALVFEETQKLADGMHTAVSVKVPIFDKYGNVESVCGISTDITERKKTEEKFKVLNEKLEMALTAGNLGLWEWHVNKNKAEWFGKSARLFGVEEQAFDGSPESVRNLIHPDDRDKGLEAFEKSIREGVIYTNTYRVIWPDGSVHWLHSYGKPEYDENGNAVKVFGTTIDITSEKLSKNKIIAQNQELSKLNAMKDKLFSILSHDLKNPLNSLLGFIQLLNMKYLNESQENIGRYISLMLKSANSMAELLNTLSQWSKSQHHRIKVSPVEISPESLAKEITSMFEANLHNKQLEIAVDTADDSHAYGDEEMIKTVLRNYLDNAIKFTPAGGRITFSVYTDDEQCVFKVSDNGVGIQPERLKDLFSVSSFDSQPGTSGEKGTGLGLIICKELAALNHGKVWAESEKGKGTDFYLALPSTKAYWEKTILNHPTSA